jgi:hypothetical protein
VPFSGLITHQLGSEEVGDIMAERVRSAQDKYPKSPDKLHRFVAGAASGTEADDRTAEHPILSLGLSRYSPDDPRYTPGCRDCAVQAGKMSITAKISPYHGAKQACGPFNYHAGVILNLLAGPPA